MYDYELVNPGEVKEQRKILISLINDVQDLLRDDYFTFQHDFNIGSGAHNLVTRLKNGNQGFDLDCNLRVNDDDQNYNAAQIKEILMDGFNHFSGKYNFSYCEDNTRVFTIKIKDSYHPRVIFSCDFAVVYDYEKDGQHRQQYIRHNKKDNTYQWAEQPKGYYSLLAHENYCKSHQLEEALKDEYMRLKNLYGPDKKSKVIYAEALNNVYMQDKAKRKK